MANSRQSGLSAAATQGYWIAVQEMLQSRYDLTTKESALAVSNYRSALDKLDVGDEVYHAPIEETAAGIVNGGYMGKPSKSELKMAEHSNK